VGRWPRSRTKRQTKSWRDRQEVPSAHPSLFWFNTHDDAFSIDTLAEFLPMALRSPHRRTRPAAIDTLAHVVERAPWRGLKGSVD
jgi:hypothetical protein